MEREKKLFTIRLLSIETYIMVKILISIIFLFYFYFVFRLNKLIHLFIECWENKPEERPGIQKVVLTLKSVIQKDMNISSIDEERKDSSLEMYLSDSKSNKESKKTIDLNHDLSLDNVNLANINEFEIESIVLDESETRSNMMESETGSSRNSFESIFI